MTKNPAGELLIDTPAPVSASKLSRSDLLRALADAGYTGPTSFTASVLAVVLAWLTNDAPAEDVDGIPNGVLYAVYPELKLVVTARVKAPSKIDQAVLAALTDVQIVLDKESAAKAKVYLADRIKALTVS